MARKGSITVFLALMLGLILSLLSSGIESARMAAARTQILNGLDIGLYSLFGQYDKSLLKDFDIFAFDGSSGGKELDLASVYDEVESYMKPVLGQNSQELSLEQGGVTGYQLLTDESGEVFYQQVVSYMRETLGSQGVQLLLKKMRNQQEKIEEAEEKGEALENGKAIEGYDAEMGRASQKSQALLEEKKKQEQQNQGQNGFTDGCAGTLVPVQPQPPAKVDNPIPVIRRMRKIGLLSLVVPLDREVSEKEIDRSTLVSRRDLEQGMAMEGKLKKENSVTSQALYQAYLMDKMGNYMNPAKEALSYQIEYIVAGKSSDEANLKAIATKLLFTREGANAASLYGYTFKMAQIDALATGIASSFLVPPAAAAIRAALVFCWAFAESVLDVKELMSGGKVPLIKSPSDWKLSLEGLSGVFGQLDSPKKSGTSGMSYEDYLQVFLLAQSKRVKIMRGMDMVEMKMHAKEGWENFRLDLCLTALEASVDVKANEKKTFTVTRAYHYI